MTLKVLVMEDDEASLKLMREIFMLHGVSIRAIKDGREAASMIHHEKFDAVFMDLVMPEFDGFELIRQVRQSSWNTHTPVVILSGRGDTEARTQAFQAGGMFFLEKPVDRAILTRLLKTTRGAMVEERRRTRRIPLSTEVACAVGLVKMLGMSSNFSLGGILFQTDGSLKRGQVVRLSFRLKQKEPAIRAKGVVVRVDETRRVGVRFVPIQPEDQQRVHDFIARAVDTL